MDTQSGDLSPPRAQPDVAAVATLTLVGIVALAASWSMPWWRMEARAPQYGQRVLVVEVNPTGFSGDVFEVDTLGHYVGIAPMASYAQAERLLGPVGLVAAFVALLVAPFVRRRRWRALVLLPVFLLPVVFVIDLAYWTQRGANDRDPTAALTLTVPRIDTQIFGDYSVGQFEIRATAGSGLFGVSTASLLALGLLVARPLELPARLRRLLRRRRAGLATALVVLGLVPSARAETLRVPAGESLAAALARARIGDTVRLERGVHPGGVVIDKAVTLAGEPGAVLDAGGRGTVLTARGPGITVRQLTLRHSGDSTTTEDAGVRLERAAGVVLEDLVIDDALFGVFAVQADHCTLQRLQIRGKDLPHTRRGDAIRLWYSSGCAVLDNTIERSRDLVIWYSSDTRVENNSVRTSRYGLHYMYSDRNSFRGNRFEDNQVGAAIMYSRGVVLEGNTFAFANGPSAHGLLIKDADDIELAHNRFLGNAVAILLDGAPQSRGAFVRVHDNRITKNGVGVTLQPLSRGVELWGNDFVRNGVQVQVAGNGDVSQNSWARDGRGNHWSDAISYDQNGDGVSELPHRIESTYEALADAHPALAFFNSSPSADALDLAARLFPIFAPRPKVTDPFPLVSPSVEAGEVGTGPVQTLPLFGAASALLAVAAALLKGCQRVLA